MKSIFEPLKIDTAKVKIRSLDQTTWQKVADGILYENSFHAQNWNLKTPEDIKNLFERNIQDWQNKKGHPIVFLSPDESEVYGITNFMNIEEPHLMTEIGGTWVGKKWQRTFVNTETKYQLLKQLIENLNYKRIEFRIDIDNLTSQKAIERIGARFEGVLRKRRVNSTGLSRDYCFYSVTDDDWKQIRPSLQNLLLSYEKPFSNDLELVIKLRSDQKFDAAFEKINALIQKFPTEGCLYYHAAWICDAGRTEQEAVSYYKNALELGLTDQERKGALLGLGSTFRSLGNYEESESIFLNGIKEFPDYKPFVVFNSLTAYNLKKYDKAVSSLLLTLIETTSDQEVRSYKRALSFYSDKLNEVFQ